MKHIKSYNESVRSLMTPKSKEDIQNVLGTMTDREMLDKFMLDYETLVGLMGESRLKKLLATIPPNRYLRFFNGIGDHKLLKMFLKIRDLEDFSPNLLNNVVGQCCDNKEVDIYNLVRAKRRGY